MSDLEQVADDGVAVLAVVAEQHGIGPRMKLLDGFKPGETQGLARDNDHQRHYGEDREHKADVTEAGAAVEQVLDQIGDAEPKAEHHQSAERGPEDAAPAKPLA